MPTTQTISVRELRQNLSLYLRATEMKKVHFVVMRHGEPVARMIPEKKKKTGEATGRGFTAGYSGGASSDSERGMVHNRRSSTARGPAPIILQWSPKADEELMRLPREIMSRVTAKMEWLMGAGPRAVE